MDTSTVISRRRWNWIGYKVRGKEWRSENKRTRGRPRTTRNATGWTAWNATCWTDRNAIGLTDLNATCWTDWNAIGWTDLNATDWTDWNAIGWTDLNATGWTDWNATRTAARGREKGKS